MGFRRIRRGWPITSSSGKASIISAARYVVHMPVMAESVSSMPMNTEGGGGVEYLNLGAGGLVQIVFNAPCESRRDWFFLSYSCEQSRPEKNQEAVRFI